MYVPGSTGQVSLARYRVISDKIGHGHADPEALRVVLSLAGKHSFAFVRVCPDLTEFVRTKYNCWNLANIVQLQPAAPGQPRRSVPPRKPSRVRPFHGGRGVEIFEAAVYGQPTRKYDPLDP